MACILDQPGKVARHRGEQPEEIAQRRLAASPRVRRLIALRYGAVEKRLHAIDQAELRIVLAAKSLETDERLEQESEIGGQYDRVLAQDRRHSVQQRTDLQILQLRVGKIEGQFAEIGGKVRLVDRVAAAPVEQH